MKRSLVMGVTSPGRSLRVLVTSAMLLAALTVTNVVISPAGAMATMRAFEVNWDVVAAR